MVKENEMTKGCTQNDKVLVGDDPSEMIEIFTEDANATGKALNRTQIHLEGHWHKTIHCWVINKRGELLIQRRSKYKKSYPDMWDVSCAGHISFGDNSKQGAAKELYEELGIKASEEELQLVIPNYKFSVVLNDGTYFDNEFIDVYLLERPEMLETTSLVLQESEVSDAKFVHFEIIEKAYKSKYPKIITHPSHQYMQFFELLKKKYDNLSATEMAHQDVSLFH